MPDEVRLSITESDRPKGRDLEVLQERRAVLTSFPPASTAVREAMIARLFLRWSKDSPNDTERAKAYAMDLAEFPAWAIALGIADIIAGVVLKAPEYRPSSLEVRGAVEARVQPVRAELGLLASVLDAPVVADEAVQPPVERRRDMADRARAMMREIGAEPEPVRRPHPTLPSAFDAPRAGNPGGGRMRISDEALGLTGRARPQGREDAA